MSELTDDRLLRYVAMLRHECAYKGPCKDNGDGCTCSAVELDARHMRTLRSAASTSTEGAGVIEQCAKIADELSGYTGEGTEDRNDGFGMFARGARYAKRTIAARIRAITPAPKVTTDEAEERG